MWPLEEIIRRNNEAADRALKGRPEVEAEVIGSKPNAGCFPSERSLAGTARNAEQAEWDAGQPDRVIKTYFAVKVRNPDSPVIPITARWILERFGSQAKRVGLLSIEAGVSRNGQDTILDARYVFFGELHLVQNIGNSGKLADTLDDICINFGVDSLRVSLDGETRTWYRS